MIPLPFRPAVSRLGGAVVRGPPFPAPGGGDGYPPRAAAARRWSARSAALVRALRPLVEGMT
jgi:hypothetical protein